MRNFIVLLIIILSFPVRAQKLNTTKLYIIEPKVGLTSYPIDKTTLPEIIADFGNNYEQYENNFIRVSKEGHPDLYEIKYKTLGISFYFFNNDSTQKIKAVKFYKPFKVKTKSNIILNESNIRDVIKRYEKSRMLISGNGIITVNAYKLTTTGIRFSSELLNFSLDNFPSEEKLKNQIVDKIYISNYQHEFLMD